MRIQSEIKVGALVLAMTSWGTSALAIAGSRSNTPEYFYQPALGGMSVALDYRQLSPSPVISTSTNGTKTGETKLSSSATSLTYAYAFSDAWALNVSGYSGERKTEFTDSYGTATSKFSGTGDFHFNLTNVTPIGSWNLHVGLGVGLSPGKHIGPNGSSDGNMLTGGTSLMNYLGLSTSIAAGTYYGFKLAYETLMERSATFGTAEFRTNGGNTALVEGFLESDLWGLIGTISAGYEFTDPAVETYADGATKTYGAYNALRAGLGLEYQFAGTVTLRLGYDVASYSERPQPAGLVNDPYGTTELSGKLRIDF